MATRPYGSWVSPITAALLVEDVVAPVQVLVDGDDIYWIERRPTEGGREVVCTWRDGVVELLPAPFSARSRVHEYGGQPFAVRAGTVYFVNDADQRLYRLDPGAAATPLTPEPAAPRAVRFADLSVAPDGATVLAVRERHGEETENDVVAIATDGSGTSVVLAAGNDFYAAPRLSPDGRRLALLTWNHPFMPWDSSELHVVELGADGSVGTESHVAGGPAESISQPRFDPDGRLHYLSDRSGYWNLYDESGAALYPVEAECGGPDWQFGQSTYVVSDGATIAVNRDGGTHLVSVTRTGVTEHEHALTTFSSLARTASGDLVALAGSATVPLAVVRCDLEAGTTETLRSSRQLAIDPGYLSAPSHISFPSRDGRAAHALYYHPKNRDFTGAPGERPPLVVKSHGGPTASARQLFDPEIQFFTSRGFAVVDVDYGGSSGYGRAYRELLRGEWGVVDVDDCAAAATYLAARGRVNPNRMVIRGGSAGGYTTLACLAFRHVFAAGASYYGVSDLAALATDTHKFESHYLDALVGPYPAARALYEARSPLAHADDITCPVIFFQGLEDAVVPPDQAERMVAALHARGVPCAYLAFPGEQHGFRQAATIRRAIEAELSFYGTVLGIAIADEVEPVEIVDASPLTR